MRPARPPVSHVGNHVHNVASAASSPARPVITERVDAATGKQSVQVGYIKADSRAHVVVADAVLPDQLSSIARLDRQGRRCLGNGEKVRHLACTPERWFRPPAAGVRLACRFKGQ